MIETLLCVYGVVVTAVALFYRGKAKEFESLYELSKNEYPVLHVEDMTGFSSGSMVRIMSTPKLNKDGSIAKKRGRKPKQETTLSPEITEGSTTITVSSSKKHGRKPKEKS